MSLKSLSGNYLTVQDNDTLVWKEACSKEGAVLSNYNDVLIMHLILL